MRCPLPFTTHLQMGSGGLCLLLPAHHRSWLSCSLCPQPLCSPRDAATPLTTRTGAFSWSQLISSWKGGLQTRATARVTPGGRPRSYPSRQRGEGPVSQLPSTSLLPWKQNVGTPEPGSLGSSRARRMLGARRATTDMEELSTMVAPG